MQAHIAQIAERLTARGQWLAVAESCTGGLLAQQLTEAAGASAWFERGIVSYANAAKQELLGVPAELLAAHGAVSEACARAMADNLLARAPVQWTVAITGIAGPGGGSADKPVGTVWIAWACATQTQARRFCFDGDRVAVRAQAARAALEGLLEALCRDR